MDVIRPPRPSGKHQAVRSTVYGVLRTMGADHTVLAGQHSMAVPPTFSAGEHKDTLRTHKPRHAFVRGPFGPRVWRPGTDACFGPLLLLLLPVLVCACALPLGSLVGLVSLADAIQTPKHEDSSLYRNVCVVRVMCYICLCELYVFVLPWAILVVSTAGADG